MEDTTLMEREGPAPAAELTGRTTVYPTTPGYQEEELELFFPHEIMKFGIIIAFISAGLTFLASLVPMPVGEPADPLRTPAGIEPEWYFLAVYQILKYVPRWLGVGFSFIVFPALLILVPFFWRPITRWRWGRLALNTVVGLGAILALTFTLLGFLGFE
jgi:quinol-cytochrome oxidoreductase complex cytochrome b subunit